MHLKRQFWDKKITCFCWVVNSKGVNRPSGSGTVTIDSIVDDDAPPDAWEMGGRSILERQGERQIQVYEDLPLGLFIA